MNCKKIVGALNWPNNLYRAYRYVVPFSRHRVRVPSGGTGQGVARDAIDDDPMSQLCGHSITDRIALGPQQGRKVFTLQTLPAADPEDQFGDTVAGLSLQAGVAARAHERQK